MPTDQEWLSQRIDSLEKHVDKRLDRLEAKFDKSFVTWPGLFLFVGALTAVVGLIAAFV